MMCELIAEKGSLMLDSIFISILIKSVALGYKERGKRDTERKNLLCS